MFNSKLSFLIPHTFAMLVMLGYLTQHAYVFLAFVLVFLVALATLDFIIPHDPHFAYQTVKVISENEGERHVDFHLIASYVFIALHILILGMGLYAAQHYKPTAIWLLYAIPVGVTGTLTLNICHEFMHAKYAHQKIAARLVASLQFWSVHEYEHLFIHHRNETSCTEEDTSYAKLNQSVYSYTFQVIRSNYQNAWKVQKQISQREKKSFYNLVNNPLLQILLLSISIPIAIALFVGEKACLFFLLQAITSMILFSVTTYHQHYGLTRRKNKEGIYEPFNYMNVWNSDHYLTSRFHLNLSHHAHHHMHQFCPYQNLKIIENAPLLPFGYLTALLVSLFPPIWYKIMNERVKNVFELRDHLEKTASLNKG